MGATPPKVVEAVCYSEGNMTEITDLPPDAIIINSQNGADVDFTISQQWMEQAGIAVKHTSTDAGSSCNVYGNVNLGDSFNFQSQCVLGVTGLTVVVYTGDFDEDECEACEVDDLSSMGEQFCAYSIEIACEPMSVDCGEPSAAPSGSFYPSSVPSESPTKSSSPSASPSAEPSASPSTSPSESPSSEPSDAPSSAPSAAPTRCPRTKPILIDTIGSTPFPDGAPPIQITFQNTTHVSVKVINTWETTFTNVYTQYHEGHFGETECLEEENVESFTEVDEYTATCMHHVPISIVNVWVVDANNEFFSPIYDAEVPECCHPPEFSQVPIVQYTFKLNCVDPCPPEDDEIGSRRLESKAENDHMNIPLKNIPLKKDPVASHSIPDKPNTDGKDGHFCVSEDYPCGEDGTRVNVCHYSARYGYKTFCVPEADSDVLAFYKKDYCGPCVRGFGEKTSRK